MVLAVACEDNELGGPAVPVDVYDPAPILEFRKDKDLAFRSDESPLIDSTRTSFKGLAYYPVDAAFAFHAPLEIFDDPQLVRIGATGGDVRMMTRFGRFTFDIAGKRCSLIVYKSDKYSRSLFVPFQDLTNATETYEVGRYIDLEEQVGSEAYLLDFNLCYNPYCAYNSTYTCPVVPEENVLPVEIRAGERLPFQNPH